MKKYLYFVIPIIILLLMVLTFIWLYPNKKDEISPSLNEVINEIPEVDNETINIIESENTSPEILENEELEKTPKIENVEEVTTKENTSKTTTSSTPPSSKTISTSKKETSTESVKKEEPKDTVTVEEKKEEKKPSSTQETKPSTPKQDVLISTDNKTDENKKDEAKKEEPVIRCTNNDNHGMSVGNTGKWFSSKDEAIAYYKSQVKYWGDWWEGTSVDDTEADATYKKNCPSGYEVWSCMYCSKWTINFYYR